MQLPQKNFFFLVFIVRHEKVMIAITYTWKFVGLT